MASLSRLTFAWVISQVWWYTAMHVHQWDMLTCIRLLACLAVSLLIEYWQSRGRRLNCRINHFAASAQLKSTSPKETATFIVLGQWYCSLGYPILLHLGQTGITTVVAGIRCTNTHCDIYYQSWVFCHNADVWRTKVKVKMCHICLNDNS